jgi:biotin synthase-related radical SAM superfamily protein
MTSVLDAKVYGLIYCAENMINNKKYIGQTTNRSEETKNKLRVPLSEERKKISESVKRYFEQKKLERENE